MFKKVEEIKDLKKILDDEVNYRNSNLELSYDKPDPLIIASRKKDEYISLICSMFAYGKASLIVKFLDSLDFSLLDKDETIIKETLKNHYYRFQNSDDIIAIFIALSRLKKIDSLENIFFIGYKKRGNILDGIKILIEKIYEIYPYHSKGYKFLVGNSNIKNSSSPLKRWNLYLRWMVRKDNLDFGIWNKIDKKDLLIPLDTHTFNISQKLGLLKSKTYNLKAVLELTESLKKFDKNDPIKYDFAIYRLGQEKII